MKKRVAKTKNVSVPYCDPGKTNYIVLVLLVLSVLAITITYRLTEKNCACNDLINCPARATLNR